MYTHMNTMKKRGCEFEEEWGRAYGKAWREERKGRVRGNYIIVSKKDLSME